MDEVNEKLLREAIRHGIDAVPLFDVSGGTGIVPDQWPPAIDGLYCGYAGGLGPETITRGIERISAAAPGQTIWIDMETRVRSNADSVFDLDKVKQCLELSLPCVGEQDDKAALESRDRNN